MQEEFEEDVKSKSQVKRDMLELTQLGTQLSELPSNELTRIPMGDTLRNAIEKAPSVTSNSARKRHLQYIGKLMRSADIDNIRAELNAISDEKDAVTRQLHAIEHWRDKLIGAEKESLPLFLNKYPNTDRQVLRQLLRACQKEKQNKKPPANFRKLFKFLRDVVSKSISNRDT